jgi:hypothetical protein
VGNDQLLNLDFIKLATAAAICQIMAGGKQWNGIVFVPEEELDHFRQLTSISFCR